MNNHFYVKFLLTVIALEILFFGILGLNSLDRLRESVLKLPDKIANTAVSAPAPAAATAVTSANAEAFANREFFVPGAPEGGELIQTISADTANLNPIVNNEATASQFNGLCSATLAERNYAKPEIWEPLMAESWTISPDHKVYHIKLRKGILWHDFVDPVTQKEFKNVEVTANDFKFMVDVIKDPAVNCEPLRIYYQDLEKVEVINDYEFVVTWSKEYYGSVASTLGLSPLPRHFYDYGGKFDGKQFNDDHVRNRMIVGCGPYRFVRWDKDRRVVFERFENYFGKNYQAMPPLKMLTYEIIKHPNTRFQAMLTGEINQLNLLPDQWVDRTNDGKFKTGEIAKYKYLTPVYSYIGYNLKNPLFEDKRVRQALTMLVDRERILKDVYFGLGVITNGPYFPASAYYNQSLAPWPYDPARAKALLKQAGWEDIDHDGILEKDGKKFVFTILQIANHPTQERTLPILKESLAAAGVDMKIQAVEWSVYTQRLEEKNFEVCMLGWQSSFDPDLYQIFHSSQADLPGSSNHVSFKNPEADQLMEEMRRTFDMDKRIELARKLGQILHDEQPYTFMFVPNTLTAIDGKYKNVRVFPGGIYESIMYLPKEFQKTSAGL